MRPLIKSLVRSNFRSAIKGALQPVIDYVARLNGTQYYEFSEEIFVPTGGSVELEVSYQGGSNPYILANKESLDTALYLDGVETLGIFSTSYLDNISVNGDSSNILPRDGEFYSVGVESTSNSTKIGLLGSRFTLERFILGSFANFRVRDSGGVILNEIPLTNKSQGAYQVATTTPLGTNLYTQEVIENPDDVGDQWSYLGEGRWQLIGDGSLSALQFLDGQDQPPVGYLQFEIESIAGGTLLCAAQALDETTFSTTGVKTYYYNNINELGQIQFKRRSGAVQAIIKNIKHYDAEGILVAEMVGYTPDVWEEA